MNVQKTTSLLNGLQNHSTAGATGTVALPVESNNNLATAPPLTIAEIRKNLEKLSAYAKPPLPVKSRNLTPTPPQQSGSSFVRSSPARASFTYGQKWPQREGSEPPRANPFNTIYESVVDYSVTNRNNSPANGTAPNGRGGAKEDLKEEVRRWFVRRNGARTPTALEDKEWCCNIQDDTKLERCNSIGGLTSKGSRSGGGGSSGGVRAQAVTTVGGDVIIQTQHPLNQQHQLNQLNQLHQHHPLLLQHHLADNLNNNSSSGSNNHGSNNQIFLTRPQQAPFLGRALPLPPPRSTNSPLTSPPQQNQPLTQQHQSLFRASLSSNQIHQPLSDVQPDNRQTVLSPQQQQPLYISTVIGNKTGYPTQANLAVSPSSYMHQPPYLQYQQQYQQQVAAQQAEQSGGGLVNYNNVPQSYSQQQMGQMVYQGKPDKENRQNMRQINASFDDMQLVAPQQLAANYHTAYIAANAEAKVQQDSPNRFGNVFSTLRLTKRPNGRYRKSKGDSGSISGDSARMLTSPPGGGGGGGGGHPLQGGMDPRLQDPKSAVQMSHLQRKYQDYADSVANRKEQMKMQSQHEPHDWNRSAYNQFYGHRSASMYAPPSSLYDDDPGIMSEAETSATGMFRRGGKQRSSLPVVRTPNKSLERPLGLVFLQYRTETKRAILPNEITSLDTVRALFVRSFPKQLTMEYLDSPNIRIYIHDPSKDMFYELEDLRDIRDRSVLRVHEQEPGNYGPVGGVMDWQIQEDVSYFSEPEFDSEYQHQHIHRKGSKGYYGTIGPGSSYNMSNVDLRSATLPHRPTSPFTPMPLDRKIPTNVIPQAPPKPQRNYPQQSLVKPSRNSGPPLPQHPPPAPSPRGNQQQPERHRYPSGMVDQSGYLSSPEHQSAPPVSHRNYSAGSYHVTPSQSFEDGSYYGSANAPRSGATTPAVDEDARSNGWNRGVQNWMNEEDDLDQGQGPHVQGEVGRRYGRPVQAASRQVCIQPPTSIPPLQRGLQQQQPPQQEEYQENIARVEQMERQLASLTGLVHKALTSGNKNKDADLALAHEILQNTPARDTNGHGGFRPGGELIQLTPELHGQLRMVRKKTKDLRQEVRNLRRMSQAQTINIRESIKETFMKLKAVLAAAQATNNAASTERIRITREEEIYKQDVSRLELDLTELETAVEDLRSNVINRRCRVNMTEVESMALILSKASKMVADLKANFPMLQDGLKNIISVDLDTVGKEEKFLKDEPVRLENALRRCKKLTGTLVTLKRLASVQEQRLPGMPGTAHLDRMPSAPSALSERQESLDSHLTKASSFSGDTVHSAAIAANIGALLAPPGQDQLFKNRSSENALDALLDELQTQHTQRSPLSISPETVQLLPCKQGPPVPKRIPSISTDSPVRSQVVGIISSQIGKLQVGDGATKHSVTISVSPTHIDGQRVSPSQEMIQKAIEDKKKVPPPPPPRTSSKSPLMSPTAPSLVQHGRSMSEPLSSGPPEGILKRQTSEGSGQRTVRTSAIIEETGVIDPTSSASSSSESVNSQEGLISKLASEKRGPPTPPTRNRKEMLEQRHQELLQKQKELQEQYLRLQQLQRMGQPSLQRLMSLPAQSIAGGGGGIGGATYGTKVGDLKKTGSESNILAKAGYQMSSNNSGSLTHLAGIGGNTVKAVSDKPKVTTNKVYETDIL